MLKEINGYTWDLDRAKQLTGINEIKDDGSTACGCWIYCGVFPSEDHNQSRSRRADGPEGPGLTWVGASPGPRTAGPCATARRPIPRASPGRRRSG